MKRCPKCREYNREDAPQCFNCRTDIQLAWTNPSLWKAQEEKANAPRIELTARIDNLLVTTTATIQDRTVGNYLGIVSAVVVLGTGVFSEMSAAVTDLLGTRSESFQDKLCQAREAALKELKAQAVRRGADAVIGIDLDYMTLVNNMLMVSVNGTAVVLTPDQSVPSK